MRYGGGPGSTGTRWRDTLFRPPPLSPLRPSRKKGKKERRRERNAQVRFPPCPSFFPSSSSRVAVITGANKGGREREEGFSVLSRGGGGDVKRGTRNPKGDDIERRGEEISRRGCSRERAEVTFNVSRHAAQGSLLLLLLLVLLTNLAPISNQPPKQKLTGPIYPHRGVYTCASSSSPSSASLGP